MVKSFGAQLQRSESFCNKLELCSVLWIQCTLVSNRLTMYYLEIYMIKVIYFKCVTVFINVINILAIFSNGISFEKTSWQREDSNLRRRLSVNSLAIH